MPELTSRERFARIFAHQEADRVPIIDDPWAATVERWQREGLPVETSFVDYFDLDHVSRISVDNSPQYPERTLEETDTYTVYTSSWGVTMKQWKHAASTPQFLAHTITNPQVWQEAKKRINSDPGRIPWSHLKDNYPKWHSRGDWIQAHLWFGFDVTHAWMVGTERVLLALAEEPGWMRDMFEVQLETDLALLDQIWQAGYLFDSIFWCDDMGYKYNQFFSLRMYRDLLKPFHQRAIDWAHDKGIKAHLHSCGDVRPFVPELVEMGLDALNPLEVKAGMDPLWLKREFGKDLVLHGGVNAVLWDHPQQIEAEMRHTLPLLKESGGYIFSSDHSVPSSVSLEEFGRIVTLAKELGAYS